MKALRYILILTLLVTGITAFAQNRTVLIEEGTGTWCQYCPRGEVIGHEIWNTWHSKVLLVAVHGNDPMEIPSSTYFSSLGFPGIPSGNLDRILLDKDPLDWMSNFSARVNVPAPVNVSLSRTYNPLTRELTINITAAFLVNMPAGDYRFGAILIEDGVTGPAPAYNQSNSYSGGASGPMGGYENLPNPVPASLMVYDHVAREIPVGYEGMPGSLPSSPQAGQNYVYSFTTTLSPLFNEKYVRVYGFVNDANTGEILNCGSSEYAAGDFNAAPFFHCDSTALANVGNAFNMNILCHDPDNDTLLITANNLPSWLSLLASGTHDAVLSGMPTAAGTYSFVLQVTDGSHTNLMNISIEVTSGGGSWVQLGPAGYSSLVSKYISPSAIDTLSGKIYTMAVTNTNQAGIYQYDGTWSQLGGNMASYSFASDICVNPVTAEPWIFLTTASGNAQVYKYSGGSWITVGNSFIANNFLQIRFSSNGTPYTASQLNGVGINIRTFDGNNWNEIQPPANPDLLGWTQMEITPSGQLILLVGEFPVNYLYHSKVFRYDGSTWSPLGSLINPDTVTTPNSHSVHKLAIGPNDSIYVALAHPNGTNVYSWTGSQWHTIAYNIDNGVRKSFDLKVNQDGKLFMVYMNTNNNGNCQSWDGNSWSYVGLPDFTPSLYDVSMVINPDGNPTVTYNDQDASMGKLSSKRFVDPALVINDPKQYPRKVSVYPNPATNCLSFSKPLASPASYYITDLAGRKLKEGKSCFQSLDISELTPGFYLLTIDGFLSQKFIKN